MGMEVREGKIRAVAPQIRVVLRKLSGSPRRFKALLVLGDGLR